MAQMARITVNWTGFAGAPGYTNLHFRDFAGGGVTQAVVDNAIARVDTWLDAWLNHMPITVNLGINPSVEVIEDTTNTLVDFMTGTPDTPRVGFINGSYSAVSGACVNWSTAGIRNGRRVRGRSFMIPLAGTAYGSDGTLDAGVLNSVRAATDVLINTAEEGDLGVYSRPSTKVAADGAWHVVSAFTIPDRASILKSRRS